MYGYGQPYTWTVKYGRVTLVVLHAWNTLTGEGLSPRGSASPAASVTTGAHSAKQWVSVAPNATGRLNRL